MSAPEKFPPEAFRLFDKYVHGLISRRDFIDRAGSLAVAGLSGAALLEAMSPKFAEAQQVAPTDARIKAGYVEIAAPGYGKVRGYLVQPAAAKGKLPTVLVVHENRGLNPHIEDIARRVASRSRILSPSRPMLFSPWAAIPARKTRPVSCFNSSTKARRVKTSSPRPATSRRCLREMAGSGSLDSATAAPSRTSWPLACRISARRCRFMAARRQLTSPISRRRCSFSLPRRMNVSTLHGLLTRRRSNRPA